MLTILTLTPLPYGGYTGKIIVDGTLYAGTFAGMMIIGNQTINFNIAPGRATGYGTKNSPKNKVMCKIELLEDMKSCITQGEKTIPAGTFMTQCGSQLSWTYFKDKNGNTLIIMGFGSEDWNKVKEVN